MIKPFAQACDRNREPILSILKTLLQNPCRVLEIGSGTGQHAVYFAGELPYLSWQCTDLAENLAGIELWIEDAGLSNLSMPIELDVSTVDWMALEHDAVFSANAVHIMSWDHVKAFISGAGRMLPAMGFLILYGPFNYQGKYTSESNRAFDGWLKDRDPFSGIRNFEDLDELATNVGLILQGDVAMPANNRIIYWQKIADENN